MSLRDRAIKALRSVFGREREERESAISPSTLAAMAKEPANIFSDSKYGQFSGLLSISNRLIDRYLDYECLTGDTMVLTLSGPVPIRELASRSRIDPTFRIPLFTWDGEKITVGFGSDARLVKRAVVYRVLLDDGTSIRATGNHRFMRRDGSYAETTELSSGDSLMPLYLSKDHYGRNCYSENDDYHRGALTKADGYRKRRVARMVAEWITGERMKPGIKVTHIGDRFDDSPDNILIKEYPKLAEMRVVSPLIQALQEADSVISDNLSLSVPPLKVMNHKVVDILKLDEQDVYCLDVPGTHNYAIGNESGGVFCHNSMDEYPDINTANHYFANDATQPNIDNDRTIWVDSPDHVVKGVANTLIKKKLKLDDEMFSIAYSLVKYGNDFEELLVTDNGVVGLNYLPPPTMRRIEHENGALVGFIQDPTGQFTDNMDSLRKMLAGDAKAPNNIALFEDWQVLHMRLRSTHRRSPYGFANCDGARWIWKRLVMLEDATLIYKLTRSPSRFAFYIDVTDQPARKINSILRQAKANLKKRQIVDPRSGKLSLQFNPLASDEDFFLPVRDGKELARIENLQGPEYQSMEPVEYFQRKLHAVLKVPREYLGQDSAIPGRAILSNEDIRAARVTLNIQKELRAGVSKLIRVDAAARSVDDPWRLNFDVRMTMPSGIYALTQFEVKNSQADFASRIEPYVSKDWIRRNIFKLSDDEIAAIEKGAEKDMQQFADVEHDLTQVLSENFSEKDRGIIPVKATINKMLDQIRRKEDRNKRESDKKHDQLLEKLDSVMRSNAAFTSRLLDRIEFARLIKDNGIINNTNGTKSFVPPGRPVDIKSRNPNRG